MSYQQLSEQFNKDRRKYMSLTKREQDSKEGKALFKRLYDTNEQLKAIEKSVPNSYNSSPNYKAA